MLHFALIALAQELGSGCFPAQRMQHTINVLEGIACCCSLRLEDHASPADISMLGGHYEF